MSELDQPGAELGKPAKQQSSRALREARRVLGTFEQTHTAAPLLHSSSEADGAGDRESKPSHELSLSRFRVAWRGYNRGAVDMYVADLEQRLSGLERELETLRAQTAPGSAVLKEIERLGDETAAILRVAHEQADAVTRRAQEEAERCRAEARSDASAYVDAAKRQLDVLDGDTDSVWRERERLIGDLRALVEELSGVANDAVERFPAEPEPANRPAKATAEPAPENADGGGRN